MIPPKMVPRALVSLGIRTTRMAGWRGPALRLEISSMRFFPFPAPIRSLEGLHGILGTLLSRSLDPGMNPISQTSPLDAMNDVALLRQVADRQPEALGVLYGRYASTLLALGKRILGSLSDGEEILQEVFLHVWNNAGRYDPGRSSVSTWLILITRSRAIDRLRTRKVVERTHETAVQETPVEHASPEGVEAVFVHERRERVRSEMDNLPPEQR